MKMTTCPLCDFEYQSTDSGDVYGNFGKKILMGHYAKKHPAEWQIWNDGNFLSKNVLANLEMSHIGHTGLFDFD